MSDGLTGARVQTMSIPSAPTVQAMINACTDHFTQLIADGCAEDVALDRTWDAYVCAFAQSANHCFDPRDRLFENKLRTIRERGF